MTCFTDLKRFDGLFGLMSQRDNAFGEFGEAEWTRGSSVSLGYSAEVDDPIQRGEYSRQRENCIAILRSDATNEETRSRVQSFKQGDSGAQKPR